MPAESGQPHAAIQLLEQALPDISAKLLPKWTERFVIIVAEVGEELRIGLLPRRHTLTFLKDMAHKLTAEEKRQFESATKPGYAPVLVRAMHPEVPGQERKEDVAMLFIPATSRSHYGA